MTLTERLASFVQETQFEQLPSAVIQAAKVGITDCVGVMLAGAQDDAGRIMGGFARAAGGNPQCTVVGQDIQTSPVLAALANGTAAHALDYDDVNWALIGHPSAFLVPTVLALGESLSRRGRDVLVAYVVGFEVAAKLGRSAMPVHSSKGGWHATGTLGCFGAAAAAAKLLRLNLHDVCVALGLASSMASGIVRNFGTMTKPFHAGHAAQNGVVAALLAEMGFTASTDVFDDPRGFFGVYCRDLPVHLETPVGMLGRPFDLETTGLVIKPYPCGVAAHPAVDGLLELTQIHGVTADDVESIDVGVTRYTFEKLMYRLPETGLQGKFSMPYILARALCDGGLSLDTFTDSQVRAPRVRELAERVHMHVDPTIESEWRGGSRPCTVTVWLSDGRTYSTTVKISKGNPEHPLTREELKLKYEDCAARSLTAHAIEASWRQLQQFEDLESVRPLLGLLGSVKTGEATARKG